MGTYRKNAKRVQGEIAADVKDALKEQLHRRCQIQNDALTAAIRVWLSLPSMIQTDIMSEPIDNILDYLRSRISPSSGDPSHVQAR